MAREDVNIKVSADVAQAVQMWKAMEEGPQGMANELESLTSRGKRGARDMTADFDKLIGKWASIAAWIGAAKAALDIYIAAQEKLNELQNEKTLSVDESSRRLFVQGSVTDAGQQSAIRQRVLGIAGDRATTGETAFASATQLVSSGFDIDEVVNQGGLDAFLKILNTTNASGADTSPDQLAKALVQYLEASGQEKTTDNLLGAGVAVQSLFRGTNLQVGNLSRFAPEASTINKFTGLGGNEMLAIFSQFLDVTDEAKGSTAFRSGAVSLATAGADKKKTAALAELGLTPEDVDFQGESFEDVRKLLTSRLGGVEGGQRNVLLKQLLGQDGLTFGNVLLNNSSIQETRNRVGLTGDRAGFDATLGIAESGVTAEERRTAAIEQQAFFDEDRNLTTDQYRRRMKAKGQMEGRGAVTQWTDEFMFERARNFTGDEGAVSFAMGGQSSEVLENMRAPTAGEQSGGLLNLSVDLTLRDSGGNEIPVDSEVNQLSNQGAN